MLRAIVLRYAPFFVSVIPRGCIDLLSLGQNLFSAPVRSTFKAH